MGAGRFGTAADYAAAARKARDDGQAELAVAIAAAGDMLAEAEEDIRYLQRVAADLAAAWDPAWEDAWDGPKVDGKAAVSLTGNSGGIRSGFTPFEDGSGQWREAWGFGVVFVPSEGRGYFASGVVRKWNSYSKKEETGHTFPLSTAGLLDALWDIDRVRDADSETEVFGRLSRTDLEIDRGDVEEYVQDSLLHAAELAEQAKP